jgi:mannose-6-phosphate isomerase-like protein (cupin superfamily)
MKNNDAEAAPSIPKCGRQGSNLEERTEWLESRPGERFRVCTSAAETKGAYSVVEIVAEPGYGTPLHVHENEDEHFIVLDGTAHIVSGRENFHAGVGASVPLRKGIPHAWSNHSKSPLRLLVTCVTGGIEESLLLSANGVDVSTVAERFAVRVVGPTITP